MVADSLCDWLTDVVVILVGVFHHHREFQSSSDVRVMFDVAKMTVYAI